LITVTATTTIIIIIIIIISQGDASLVSPLGPIRPVVTSSFVTDSLNRLIGNSSYVLLSTFN
jgi:hypothetical protein